MRSAKKQERKYRTVNTAAPHALKKRLLTLALSLAFLLTCLPAALAVDLNVDAGFYFKQSRGGTCTLASAAMMLRRRAYFDGLSDWTNVTENSVRSTAWANGLAHSFTYKEMQVGYATLPSGLQSKTAVLISLLEQHPEGIVLYDRTQPHAVLLTDYTNGIFYCSDPAGNIGYGRIPITSSSVSIARSSCYWYVTADHNSVAAQADGLRLDALPEKIQTAWNDVLAAQVCWIRQGAYGPEIVLAGVDPQRVYDFSFMLIEEIDECPGQAPAPGLSME